uniref:hypothetical protein n=1 Tax=uncultured Dysgonomonas sp. TaxID=206096 RepID=UPI00261DB804|nr:hypothetical protein [uncultured Dysgonomonas sp.]
MTFTKRTQTKASLAQKVELLLDEVNSTHRYSMSRIYGLYNEVFNLAEVPQSCASCLIRKVNELKSWLIQQPENENSITTKTEPVIIPNRKKNKKA